MAAVDRKKPQPSERRGGVPRGLLQTGPVLFSYGFRPFFLGAALWACAAMALGIAAMAGRFEFAGDYGVYAWHAHEMLFGFGSAVLAGFLLTSIPNWTGRLPVSGKPLACLFALWCFGRIAMLMPGTLGLMPAAAIDASFLPALLAICMVEVVAGRRWANLKIMFGLGLLSAANIGFHYETVVFGAPDYASRLAAAAYTLLVTIVGGRMLPSFTRNWLAKQGRTDFPSPHAPFDTITIAVSVMALLIWTAAPDEPTTAAICMVAAALQFIRLYRWRGWTVRAQPLVLILHLVYLFVPLGLVTMAAAAMRWIDPPAALHVVTIGTMASMMLAVMTRATRGHTGRQMTSSLPTNISYAAILLCAAIRPLSAFLPEQLDLIHASAAILWLAAFALHLCEYGPMLTRVRRRPNG